MKSVRLRALRARTALATVLALFASLLVLTAAASPAQAASSLGGAITRSEVIARAQYWVDHQPGSYNQSGTAPGPGGDKSYRRDCSGYVSMAWHLAATPAPSTWELPNYSTTIAPQDLRAGDMLDIPHGHALLFDKWVDRVMGTFWYYSFGSAPVHHSISNVALDTSAKSTHFDGHPISQYQTYRYNKIVDDAVNSDRGPIGAYDLVRSDSAGTVTVLGWAFDPDSPTTPVSIHVYVGGPAGSGASGYNTGPTNQARSDVKAVYPQSGATTGFAATVNAPAGNDAVYVYAIDNEGGTNPLLGTKTVSVADPNPVAWLDAVSSPVAGRIRVQGWAFDRSDTSQRIHVHVYVGGAAGSGAPGYDIGATDQNRPDVVAAVPGAGPTTGFSGDVSADGGTTTVYVYAINIGTGNNVFIGSRSVSVANPNPEGVLDLVTSPSAGKIQVQGWAFDRSDTSQHVHIHVYVGGAAGSGAPSYDIGAAGLARPDVPTVISGAGPSTGFSGTVNATSGTTVPVYVYAINVGYGTNSYLGTKTVAVK